MQIYECVNCNKKRWPQTRPQRRTTEAYLHVQLHDGNTLFAKEWLQRNKQVQHVIFFVSEVTLDGADLLNHRVDGCGMKARAIGRFLIRLVPDLTQESRNKTLRKERPMPAAKVPPT
jgi:predicted protein tyrosine phosphatase